MNAEAWDAALFAGALLCAAGFAWYFVRGVLDGDRTLSRAAAAGFFVLAVAATVSFLRIFS